VNAFKDEYERTVDAVNGLPGMLLEEVPTSLKVPAGGLAAYGLARLSKGAGKVLTKFYDRFASFDTGVDSLFGVKTTKELVNGITLREPAGPATMGRLAQGGSGFIELALRTIVVVPLVFEAGVRVGATARGVKAAIDAHYPIHDYTPVGQK
jgi:hypothetical protein